MRSALATLTLTSLLTGSVATAIAPVLAEGRSPIHSTPSQTAISSEAPRAVVQAVLRNGRQEWGATRRVRVIATERTAWADGCETIRVRMGCDPVMVEGWKIILANGNQQWIYFTDATGDRVQLAARESQVAPSNLPENVKNSVLSLASQHLRLRPLVLLVRAAEAQTWSNGCLGLPSPVERCMMALTPGWQVTVEGKPGDVQIYRTNADGTQIRTEAGNGMPARTDTLANAIARSALETASRELRVSTEQIYILQVEQIAGPGFEFLWNVTVNGGGQSRTYQLDYEGRTLSSGI